MQTRLEGIRSIDLAKFLKNIDLNNNNLSKEFKKNFVNWISNSKLNNIQGLDKFNSISITNGSIQIFDHFYLRHHKRRFRFLQGEFMYHKAVCKHDLDYVFLENDKLRSNDAFIMSIPYTRKGIQHPDLLELLHYCNKLNIPVLLDFAHFPVAKNININLNEYNCIETLAFSMSKFCYGAEYLRVGIRMQKENIDDGIDTFNSVDMYHRINIDIANQLIHQYSVDYNWNTFNEKYSITCTKNKLKECDNILVGFRKDERVIISQLLCS